MSEEKHYNIFGIRDYQPVTLTKTNNIIELQYLSRCNTRATIKKLDSEHYMLLKTREIKKFKKSSSRKDLKNSLMHTFKNLRYLINNNFCGMDNELFVTLTYRDNMTDLDTLYIDFKNFIKRFKYYMRDKTSIDYISVVEPQQRGAWHCHVLFRFNDLKNVYIKNSVISDLWKKGFVNVKKLKNIDNVGAYLTAYLTDLSIDEIDGDINGTIKNVNGKKYVKGSRLELYPPGTNIYRYSRGIKKPERQLMSFKKAKTYVGGLKPTYVNKLEF
ncbi:MAG: hypothetical protein E6330_08465, partial [Dialister sp.]|nr:hypothetical protein [Dialister sp.]MDU7143523.1 hypothetical protein [Anaerococcus vaginalis]